MPSSADASFAPEPVGVIGIIAPDEAPLLGLISLLGQHGGAGPVDHGPLVATDLYQVLEYSDIPAGAINIVTGHTAELTAVLAKHNDVDGLWVVAEADICAKAEAESTGNLKRVWTDHGRSLDWPNAQGEAFLRCAIEVKNVWVPYGD